MINEKDLQAAIAENVKKKGGFAITKDFIDSQITSVKYFVIEGTTVTICHLTLDNGFSVRGESACIDPTNFNEEIGQQIAYKNAYDKLWAFYGFAEMEITYRFGED